MLLGCLFSRFCLFYARNYVPFSATKVGKNDKNKCFLQQIVLYVRFFLLSPSVLSLAFIGSYLKIQYRCGALPTMRSLLSSPAEKRLSSLDAVLRLT